MYYGQLENSQLMYNATRNHVYESNLEKTKMELSNISRIQKRDITPAILCKFKVKSIMGC